MMGVLDEDTDNDDEGVPFIDSDPLVEDGVGASTDGEIGNEVDESDALTDAEPELLPVILLLPELEDVAELLPVAVAGAV